MNVYELCMNLANNNVSFINKIKHIFLHCLQFFGAHFLFYFLPNIFLFASHFIQSQPL